LTKVNVKGATGVLRDMGDLNDYRWTLTMLFSRYDGDTLTGHVDGEVRAERRLVILPVRTPLPDYVAGKWVYRDYDAKAKKDLVGGFTQTWELSKDNKGKTGDGGTGKVTSYASNEIKLEFANGSYKGTITWDPWTNIGQTMFTDAPDDSPKKKDKGPYDISMRRN
jgi:hypothetical protein